MQKWKNYRKKDVQKSKKSDSVYVRIYLICEGVKWKHFNVIEYKRWKDVTIIHGLIFIVCL